MLDFVKEKSWSVKLTGGYVLNGQIRSDHCEGCEATTKIITGNNGNHNLVLFGCNGHKCKHTLIRVDFNPENAQDFSSPKQLEPIQLTQQILQS